MKTELQIQEARVFERYPHNKTVSSAFFSHGDPVTSLLLMEDSCSVACLFVRAAWSCIGKNVGGTETEL
eukprot:1923080-Amphidinium_carterae.1